MTEQEVQYLSLDQLASILICNTPYFSSSRQIIIALTMSVDLFG